MLTAYAPDIVPDPGAARALQILIERETTASALAPAKLPSAKPPRQAADRHLRTAHRLSRRHQRPIGMKNIFDMTWTP